MTSDAGNISKSGESSFTELGKDGTRVAETLVSITSLLGGFEICKCNGVFIDFEGFSAGVKSILTSASLCRLSDIDFTGASWDDVTIKVCLPNGEFSVGKLHYCDLESGLAVVNISNDYDFAAVDLSSKYGKEYGHEAVEAVAFRRCFDSGSLIPTPKVLIPYGGTPWNFENDKAWIGGPLVNVEGDFLGIICSSGEGNTFLRKNEIVDWLNCEKPVWQSTVTTVNEIPRGWSKLGEQFKDDETKIFMYNQGWEYD